MIGAITAGLYGTGVPPVTNSYESIQTVTLGSSASSISFTSIPSTYKHLQIRLMGQSDRATVARDGLRMRLNSDTGSNYAWHWLQGDGSSASATATTSTDKIITGEVCTTAGPGGVTFAAGVIDLLDYTSTSKNKTVRFLVGDETNGVIAGTPNPLTFGSGVWLNSGTAVSTITFTPNNGTNFTTNTRFALYGIKG